MQKKWQISNIENRSELVYLFDFKTPSKTNPPLTKARSPYGRQYYQPMPETEE